MSFSVTEVAPFGWKPQTLSALALNELLAQLSEKLQMCLKTHLHAPWSWHPTDTQLWTSRNRPCRLFSKQSTPVRISIVEANKTNTITTHSVKNLRPHKARPGDCEEIILRERLAPKELRSPELNHRRAIGGAQSCALPNHTNRMLRTLWFCVQLR